MDGELYDEFGNYIGPDLDESGSDDDAPPQGRQQQQQQQPPQRTMVCESLYG